MKMKEMLNNIGAVSKQVIVGSVIGVATLAVGIGLMNNFRSGNTEEGFASNALERSSSYSSAYTGASAQDIMSARDYAGSSREGSVSAITGTERLAVSNRRNLPGTVAGQAGQGGSVEGAEGLTDSSQGYGDGEIEGMGTSNQIAIDVALEDEAKAQAQRDAKIAKGQALGEQARATLKTSKMASESGLSGMPTGSSSMAYNMSGGAAAGSRAGGVSGDSSKISLDQAKLSNVNLQAAKAGKLDGMGSGSTEADGKRIGRASVGQNYQSLGDLGRASKYSKSGKEAVVADSAQGAADAAAAFDGSKEAEVANLQGENLQKAAANSLQDMGAPNMNWGLAGIQEDLEDVEEVMNKWSKLVDKIKDCILAMVLAASIASLGVFVASKSGPWGPLIAGIIAAAGTTAILASAIAAYVYLGQIAQLAKQYDFVKAPTAWEWAEPWVIGTCLGGVIALSYAVAYSQSAIVTKFLLPAFKSIGGSGAMYSVTHFLNRIFKKK